LSDVYKINRTIEFLDNGIVVSAKADAEVHDVPEAGTEDNLSSPAREDYQNIIKEVSAKKGFDNTKGLLRLSHCESRFDTLAVNRNKDGTQDNGLFQINNYWHKDMPREKAIDPYLATEWTINKINDGGIGIWACQWAYFDNNYNYNEL